MLTFTSLASTLCVLMCHVRNAVLRHIHMRSISHHAVRTMLAQFDTSSIKRHPPTTQQETEALALLMIHATVSPLPSPHAATRGHPGSLHKQSPLTDASIRNECNAAASSHAIDGDSSMRSCRASAVAAAMALADVAQMASSPHKRKRTASKIAGTPAPSDAAATASAEPNNAACADSIEGASADDLTTEPDFAITQAPSAAESGSNSDVSKVASAAAAVQALSSRSPSAVSSCDMQAPQDGEQEAEATASSSTAAPRSKRRRCGSDATAHSSAARLDMMVDSTGLGEAAIPLGLSDGVPSSLPHGAAPTPSSMSPSPPAAHHTASTDEKYMIDKAIARDEVHTPRITISHTRKKQYAAFVNQQLQATHRELHHVHSDGDCLLASVLLGCQAIGIDVCKEQGLRSSHPSSLRQFMAEWTRSNKQQLFDISGGDESWRGERIPVSHTRRNGVHYHRHAHMADGGRLTLDGCLDAFADIEQRSWSIPWSSMDPEAASTDLCDYMPQLLAIALKIRIVLIKPHGPPEAIGERDESGQLVADASREIMLVQSIKQDHWDVALPLPQSPSTTAVHTSLSTPSMALAQDTPASNTRLQQEINVASTPAAAVDSHLSGSSTAVTPTKDGRERMEQTPSPSVRSGSGSEARLEHAEVSVRRRILAATSMDASHLQQLKEELAQVQAVLGERERQHAIELQQMQDTIAKQTAQLSQQQLVLDEMKQQHVSQLNELRQALIEQEQRSDAVLNDYAAATLRIEQLVHGLEMLQVDHKARVHGPTDGVLDTAADILQQMLALQATLPSCHGDDEIPFFHLPQSHADEWTIDIEQIETKLGGPFRTHPEPVDAIAAQDVCNMLRRWLTWLNDEEAELSFMSKLLLIKKLQCMDQLRPSTKHHPPYHVLELRALLSRLIVHKRVWSFALRLSCGPFASSMGTIRRHAACCYISAARAAAPNIAEQARLLVEQCKMLEEHDALHEAKGLDSIVLAYPDGPLAQLQSLHAQYPEAGAPFSRHDLEQLDAAHDEWQTAVHKAEAHALKLERRVQRNSKRADPTAAERARVEADKLAATPYDQARRFVQCMKKSRAFFHSDKRSDDRSTSPAEQLAQFSQATEAWEQLSSCRQHFQELRIFRAKVARLGAVSSVIDVE